MKIMVSPWKSETPRALASHLGAKLIRLSKLVGNEKRPEVLINWGCSDVRGLQSLITINSPMAVRNGSNKRTCLNVLGVNKIHCLDWTLSQDIALEWMKKGHSVIAHSDVHGHSGRGLRRVPATEVTLPACELYTKYFAKDKELRILCIRNGTGCDTMFLEKKRILPERYAEFGLTEKPDWWIRTHDNGWIFSREAQVIPAATELAKAALKILGLSFGAVDILAKKNTGVEGGWECKVGEVNTAPGLTGQTLDFFKDGLTRLVKSAAF